jgi:hypothetical protein
VSAGDFSPVATSAGLGPTPHRDKGPAPIRPFKTARMWCASVLAFQLHEFRCYPRPTALPRSATTRAYNFRLMGLDYGCYAVQSVNQIANQEADHHGPMATTPSAGFAIPAPPPVQPACAPNSNRLWRVRAPPGHAGRLRSSSARRSVRKCRNTPTASDDCERLIGASVSYERLDGLIIVDKPPSWM